MGKSFSVTVDGDATPDSVTVPVRCSSVRLWSKDSDVTGGIDVYVPPTPGTAVGSITPARYSEGERIIVAAQADGVTILGGSDFDPGQVVCYLKSVASGPFTIQGVCL